MTDSVLQKVVSNIRHTGVKYVVSWEDRANNSNVSSVSVTSEWVIQELLSSGVVAPSATYEGLYKVNREAL